MGNLKFNGMTKFLCLLLIAIVCSCVGSKDLTVENSEMKIYFTSEGEIERAEFSNGEMVKEIKGATVLEGCVIQNVKSEELSDGGVLFRKIMKDTINNHRFALIESFIPTPSSIRWEIKIKDDGDFWTCPITTVLKYPASKEVKFWTAWADPRGDISQGGTENALIANAIINSGDLSDFNSWADPLVALPLKDSKWHYGAPRYEYDNPGILYCPFQGNVICIPLVSFMEEKTDFGLSLALSPEDLLLDMDMTTTAKGEVKFLRYNYRLGKGKELKFSMDIVPHQADWRSSLGWMVQRYEEYFHPVNPLAHQMGGTGAYSNSDVSFDVDKMKKMDFRVNWRASFDFPYMGMFIPPVDDDVTWLSFIRHREIGKVKRKPISISGMNAYCKRMLDNGFYVLSYFNVTEFGTQIEYPYTTYARKKDQHLWKNANDYLYENLADAMLFVPEKQKPILDKGIYSARPGLPFFSWELAVAMDPGVKSYQDFLVDQAKLSVEKLPFSSGICIDRMDWTRFYNHNTDDGVSWMGNQPVGSMYVSWNKIMERLNPVFHEKNKVIFVNNHVKRIEQLKYVDGILDEFTYAGSPLNTVAMMCPCKPALGWMSNDEQLLPDPDVVMQKYLYLGVYPMAPFPGNDHSIRPSKLADKVYLDYGPLFKLLRGKEWVLEPHVVSVTGDIAKANLFKTLKGYAVPLVYAQDNEPVEVSIDSPEIFEKELTVTAFYPGETKGLELFAERKEGKILLKVPVKRHCAVVKIETN